MVSFMAATSVIAAVRRHKTLERIPMKRWSTSVVVLIGFTSLGTITSAQDKLERRIDPDVVQQLELIVKRLESIEKRLQRLERGVEPLAFPFERPVEPLAFPFERPVEQDNVLIRWRNPRAVISPSVDAGMLLDAYERNRERTR